MTDPANYAYSDDDADDEEQEFDLGEDAIIVDDVAEAMHDVRLDEKKESKQAAQLNDDDTALGGLLKEMNLFLAQHPINGKTIQLREVHVQQDEFGLNRYQQKIECFARGDDEIKNIGYISYAIIVSPLSAYFSYKSDYVSILEMKLTAPYQNIGLEHFLIYAVLNDAFHNNYDEDCPVEVVVLPGSFREVLKDTGFTQTEHLSVLRNSLQQFISKEKDCLAKAKKLFTSKSHADRTEDIKRAIKLSIDRIEVSDKRIGQCLSNFKTTVRNHSRNVRTHE